MTMAGKHTGRGAIAAAATAVAAAVSIAFAPAASAQDPGVTDSEVKIGDVTILSGPGAFIGQATAIGLKIAAGEANEKGGVAGRKVTIALEDDGYVPSRSFQAAKKLIEVDRIFALVGMSGSANALAMVPLVEENKLPAIASTAPNKQLYTPVRPTLFALGADYSDAFYAQIRYIHERLAPKGAVYGIIRQDDDFGQSVEDGYARAVKEFGLKDALRLRYKRGQRDFAAEALRFKNANINVLASGAVLGGNSALLRETRKLGMDLQVATVWTEHIPIAFQPSLQAGYDYIVADYVPVLSDLTAQQFLERTRKYISADEQKQINRYTLTSYAAARAMLAAMEKCGKNLTRACTVAELKKTKNLDVGGIMAPISFDNPKQLSGTAIKLYQLDAKNGSFRALTDFRQY
jgi:ABC-type branched-subunit amino acid transport system substrate-binding protein